MQMSSNVAKAITVLDVLVASGFALAGLFHPQAVLPAADPPTPGAGIFALYAAARTLPLAVFVLIAIFKNWRRTLVVLAILAGTIQFMDFFVGLAQHDIGKTVGPLVLAILQFAALPALRREAGRDWA